MAELFGVQDMKKSVPMTYGADLPAEGPAGDAKLFRSIIGSLLYAATSTRPDIAHVRAAKNIVAYLSSTPYLGLRYVKSDDLVLEVYADASFSPNEHGRKSRTGYVILINGAPVSWKSTLQRQIAHSTAEAEYISLSDAARELKFVRTLILELGHVVEGAVNIYEDNQTALIMATEVTTKRSKHVDIRFHHIRDVVANKELAITYVPSRLPLSLLISLLSRCCVKPSSSIGTVLWLW